MKLIDPEHPFYAPAWRRYAIAASCFIWAGVEAWAGQPFWTVIFGALGAYSFWTLVWTFGKK